MDRLSTLGVLTILAAGFGFFLGYSNPGSEMDPGPEPIGSDGGALGTVEVGERMPGGLIVSDGGRRLELTEAVAMRETPNGLILLFVSDYCQPSAQTVNSWRQLLKTYQPSDAAVVLLDDRDDANSESYAQALSGVADLFTFSLEDGFDAIIGGYAAPVAIRVDSERVVDFIAFHDSVLADFQSYLERGR